VRLESNNFPGYHPPPPPNVHGSVGVQIHFHMNNKQTLFELAPGTMAWTPPGIFSGPLE
jgi:hypothetical protein